MKWGNHKKRITGIAFDSEYEEDMCQYGMEEYEAGQNDEDDEDDIRIVVWASAEDPETYDMEIFGDEAEITDMLMNAIVMSLDCVEQAYGHESKREMLLTLIEFLKDEFSYGAD